MPAGPSDNRRRARRRRNRGAGERGVESKRVSYAPNSASSAFLWRNHKRLCYGYKVLILLAAVRRDLGSQEWNGDKQDVSARSRIAPLASVGRTSGADEPRLPLVRARSGHVAGMREKSGAKAAATDTPRASVWRDGDFLKLWTGETISLFGSAITTIALPLTAVITLDASGAELGALNAAKYAPFFLVALFVGAWVDRWRRRPVLLVANGASAVAVATVPLASGLGVLTIEELYVVAFLLGVLTVFLQTAFWAYGPFLVEGDRLVEANSKLYASSSAADIAGPGLGGALVQLFTAPVALLADAISFLVASVSIGLIEKREPAVERDIQSKLWTEIREGLGLVLGNRYLRAIAGEAGTYNLFVNAFTTAWLIYAARDLGLSAALIGLLYTTAGVGAFLGSMIAPYPQRWFGLGPTIVGSMILGTAPFLAIPLASSASGGSIALVVAAFLAASIGIAISNVHVMSLRQAITPARLLGRMMASYRFLTWGGMPLGALLGGTLTDALGARQALVIACTGIATAPLWVLFSPIARLRSNLLPKSLPQEP
jgi:MFS family permease